MVSVALMDPIRVVRDFADADSIELATLEAVIGMVGAGLGKPNMESMAKEIVQCPCAAGLPPAPARLAGHAGLR